MAELELAGSPDHIQVLNTHLDERSRTNRARSASQLLQWLHPTPSRIVIGDFNAQVTEPTLRILTEDGLTSALAGDDHGTLHRFRGGRDGPQIDHILVSPNFAVVSSHVFATDGSGRRASDHWPVVAELELRP